MLELAAAPAHLARIRVRCRRHLLCSAISATGELVAASDAFAVHLFAVAVRPGRRLRITTRALPDTTPPAMHMVRDGSRSAHARRVLKRRPSALRRRSQRTTCTWSLPPLAARFTCLLWLRAARRACFGAT